MKELLEASLATYNFIPTLLLLLVIFYWLTVIIGALDLEFLDFDLDAEIDAEVEVDAGLESGDAGNVDGGNEFSASWLQSLLTFFNIGKVPFMVFISMLALPWWVITVLGNYYLGVNSLWIGLIVVVPALMVSLFMAKFLTYPLVVLFKNLEKEDKESKSAVGKICRAMVTIHPGRVGQGQVETSGSPLLLNITTRPGITLQKGETALVLEFDDLKNHYLVEPYNTQ